MKVWHVIDSGGMYGAEIMLLNLIAAQKKIGLIPEIISIGLPNQLEKELELHAKNEGYNIFPVRMRKGLNLLGAYKIVKKAHECNVDMIHCHGYKANILFGFMPKRILKMPIVCTLHGWITPKNFSKMSLYIWLDVISLKYFDAVIVVNQEMLKRKELSNKSKLKLHVVNNGITADPIKCDNRNKDGIQKDMLIKEFCSASNVIGSVGRLSIEKGFKYLISATKKLINEGVNVRLILIGEGPEKAYLKNQAQSLGIEKSVLFAGFCANAECYMSLFDILVLPSLTEGLPITVLEAMKNRVPIVASNVGGIPNVIDKDKGGMLVAPKNEKMLFDAIKSLIENKKLKKIYTQYSYNKFRANYTSDQMAKSYQAVYRKVLEK